jgi:hypothetical protein
MERTFRSLAKTRFRIYTRENASSGYTSFEWGDRVHTATDKATGTEG